MRSTTISEEILTRLRQGKPSSKWQSPVLIGIFGLPCAGKTEIARYLSKRHSLIVFSTDSLRLEYGLPSGPATHALMYELAAELLPQQHSLIFDGIHLGRKDRDALRRFAERYGVESKIVYTTAVPHIIQERLQARIQSPEQTSAEGKFVIMPDHFLKLASYLEPPADDEDVVVIDTSQGLLDENLLRLDTQLRKMFKTPE